MPSPSRASDVILARGVLMRDRESEVTRETSADTSDDDEEDEVQTQAGGI